MTDEEIAFNSRHNNNAVTVVLLPNDKFAVLDKQFWVRGVVDTPLGLDILIREVIANPPLAPHIRHKKWKEENKEINTFLTDLGL